MAQRNTFNVDEKLETPFNLKHLMRTGKYIRRHKGKMILVLITSVICIVIALMGPLIIKAALELIEKASAGEILKVDAIKTLIFYGVLLLATIAGNIGLSSFRSVTMARVGQTIIYEIRRDLFAHLQELSFDYFDNRPAGKILIRVVHYINSVSDALSNGIINLILECLNIVIILIFMLVVSPSLTLVALAGLPVFAFAIFFIMPKQRRGWQNISNANSNMSAYVSESIDGAKITQVFTREKENMGIYKKLNKHYRRVWMKTMYPTHSLGVVVENISAIVVGGIYVVAVFVLNPAASFPVVITMGNYAARFWQPILNISSIYNTFINAVAYLERIFEAIDEPVTVADKEYAYSLPDISGAVSFKNVTFSYTEDTPNILENVNFSVDPGQSVALVGPTGAGKTTIINILARFYNLDSGDVLLDGHSINDVTGRSLRSRMGIMLQDSFIFSGTIADNVRYGKLDATDEEIEAACRAVYCHDYISSLPQGYQTVVGEKGSELSTGQRQLICFARTLISDPKILILDEATSSIDAKTESLLQQAIASVLKNRTSFIVAHRLSTIMDCDRIMYIANKGIAESGSHSELMELGGEYAKLYRHLSEM